MKTKQKRFNLRLLILVLPCLTLSLWALANVASLIPEHVVLPVETVSPTAEESNLKVHYTFDNVSGHTVPDESGSGYNGTLMSNASILEMGKYNVLSLGSGTGYLDMGQGVGTVISSLNNYTISLYYRVDVNATITGNGFFLWSFSQLLANGADSGPYLAYRVNDQRFALSTGGYNNEKAIQIGGNAAKGVWQHLVYRQNGATGELYLDGKVVGRNYAVPPPSSTFTSSAYNWIGRPPFSGDNYLKNTLVYDFRLYDKAVADAQITEWAGLVKDLEQEFAYGSVGDFTQLSAYIAQCNSFLSSAGTGDYPEMAVTEFEDAIGIAQEMVDDQNASQFAIDDCLTILTAALTKFKSTKGFDKGVFSPMPEYNPEKGFKHPGALHTQEDFDRVKALLAAKDPTLVAAYNALKANAYSQSTVTTSPTETIVRGGGVGENYMNAARGASMAYLNALRWKIGGEKAHAEKAIEILNSWASICKAIGGDSNYALAGGLYGYAFVNAAELMRDYEGWQPADFKKVRNWVLDVWYPYCVGFLRGRNGTWGSGRPGHYWSNWPLCNALAVMSIGVFCDDVFIYNQGVSFYKHDQVGTFKENRTPPVMNDGLTEYIGNLVPVLHKDERGPFGYLGQMQESGRDQSHALMALGLAVDMCQVAWNQGDDLFSLMDNRLVAGIEYLAAYNTGIDEVPWMEYWYQDVRTAVHNSWKQTGNGDVGRGAFRPYWDRIIGHYEGVKGIQLTYAHAMKEKQPIDNAGSYYGQTSGAYDHLGFSTLMCYRPTLTPEQAPTLILPTLIYNGKTYNQSELGGLVNTYRNPGTTSALPAGSVIKFVPTLPAGVTDTGHWKWEDGTTTKDLEITANSSGLYRVTYTNERGIKSTQLYSIAVAGDCNQDPFVTSITADGVKVNDTIISVQRGASLTLTAWSRNGESGWGNYKWNNGATTSGIEVSNILSDRTYSVIYTNQGGRQIKVNFHIHVDFMLPSLSVNGGAVQGTNTVVVSAGQSVELIPVVPAGKGGGIWKWDNGAVTQNLLLENVQSSGTHSVTYTYREEAYKLNFRVYIAASGKSLADGTYYIKNATTGTYLTNDGLTTAPAFSERDPATPSSQIWKIVKDGLRYKITSTADDRFLNENGQLAAGSYSIPPHTYTLYGVVDGDLYSIQNSKNAGLNYWAINTDGTIKGKGTSSLSGYPFEIVSANGVGIEEIVLGDLTVYPNPVQDYLVVNLEEPGVSDALFTLFSLEGRPLKTISCRTGENGFQLSDLPSGMYFGVLHVNGQKKTAKIIKK